MAGEVPTDPAPSGNDYSGGRFSLSWLRTVGSSGSHSWIHYPVAEGVGWVYVVSHESVLLPQENSIVPFLESLFLIQERAYFLLPEQPHGISPHFGGRFPSWANDSSRQRSLIYRVPLNRPSAASMSWPLKAILQFTWGCRYFFEIMTSFTFNQYPEVEFLNPGGYFLIIWWEALSSVWAKASQTGF